MASPAAAAEPLADQVANAAGLATWSEVREISFEWKHAPSGTTRAYVWDVAGQRVDVTTADGTTSIDLADPAQRTGDAYGAFINDSYWPLFPLHLAWDEGIRFEEVDVDAKIEGATRALRVQYGDVGITPGDTYVLYLDDALRDVGWTYISGRDPNRTLTTTRAEHRVVQGIRVPTRFATPTGETFIEVPRFEIRGP
jgi:YD repeat-containing protein